MPRSSPSPSPSSAEAGSPIKPFLKWAGGKFKIISRIRAELPPGDRLLEPFAGSGAVFLNTSYPAYHLTDSNPDLIHLFRQLQQEGQDFISFARGYFVPEYNTQQSFNAQRDISNSTKDTRLKSALFLYLNRHCFNGLCRYNSKGAFNVPFGRYKSPHFPEKEMLAFHEKSHYAMFNHVDFRVAMQSAKLGDVVYCDPPYVPLTDTANFTSYGAGGFNMKDQQDLADLARSLQSRGIHVVISNHDTEWTRTHYSPARLITFDVQRFISSDTGNRGKVGEILAIFEAK